MTANGRKRTGKDGDWGGWALIVLCFLMGLWPLGLVLLFFKLFGKDEKKRTAPPLQPTAAQAGAARPQSKAGGVVRKVTRSPSTKRSTARWLKICGGALGVIGLIACWEPISMMLWLGEAEIWYVEDLLTALAMAVAGVAMVWSGVSMDRALKRYAKYLAVVGQREAMSTEELARTLGFSRHQVEQDLQKMIDRGYFGDGAYLHAELGYLFRSSQADEALRRQRAAQAAPPPKEAEEGYSGILRNIRRANDEIADPILSAKIDQLEAITARIFRAVEEDPKKRSRIDTFLNYYLPTTQKLLDSYAEFEAAGVEGENLRQAKARIEATMDAIVQGFAHQLDALYQADAMDVDSDIRVMETMLRRDTASAEKDFGLGGEGPADKTIQSGGQ